MLQSVRNNLDVKMNIQPKSGRLRLLNVAAREETTSTCQATSIAMGAVVEEQVTLQMEEEEEEEEEENFVMIQVRREKS